MSSENGESEKRSRPRVSSTAWAIIGTALTVAGLIIGIYQYRASQIAASEQVVVTLSTDEISTYGSDRTAFGNQLTVTARGLRGDEQARVYSNDRSLGEVNSHGGTATFDYEVPIGTPIGDYVIKVQGLTSRRFGGATLHVRRR